MFGPCCSIDLSRLSACSIVPHKTGQAKTELHPTTIQDKEEDLPRTRKKEEKNLLRI